jgi:hypothetical protein
MILILDFGLDIYIFELTLDPDIIPSSIKLAAFKASGGACMKLHSFRQDLQD